MTKGRYCAKCGRRYWKANRFRMWQDNERADEKICTGCLSPSAIVAVLRATDIRIVPGPKRRRA